MLLLPLKFTISLIEFGEKNFFFFFVVIAVENIHDKLIVFFFLLNLSITNFLKFL